MTIYKMFKESADKPYISGTNLVYIYIYIQISDEIAIGQQGIPVVLQVAKSTW